MNALAQQIQGEIAAHGPIRFERFMELALYAPGLGYYERAETAIGRKGDFHTSASASPLFGELLARRLLRWARELPNRPPDAAVVWAEAGAHHGQLAHDILTTVQELAPAVLARLEYWIIEPSSVRRRLQEAQLSSWSCVRWFHRIEDVPDGSVRGAVLSNELLDAFPVRRIGWSVRGQAWFEWGVGIEQGAFCWRALPLPEFETLLDEAGFELPAAFLAVLPDKFTLDLAPAALAWWRQSARKLGAGHLLTFDYGLTADEWLRPERSAGSLRGYRRHRHIDDLLEAPGEHDLTAHVNFTAIERAGLAEGLRTVAFERQSLFLTRIAAEVLRESAPWNASRIRQFHTLTHPEHLGRAFRALVQRK